LLAEAERHPRHVLACASCGALNVADQLPTRARPARCTACGGGVHREGAVERRRLTCRGCRTAFAVRTFAAPLPHRLWALEYRCGRCYPGLAGRQFKEPDAEDRELLTRARARLRELELTLPLPDDPIPAGDETDRLHRWGYRRYRELFNERQLLGLGLLLRRVMAVPDADVRHALLTVFSDTLRYQNMLCRYDTYALKCQDVFSVHGFPVGLTACENNLLGQPGVGSGGFRHFVEKYARAKDYCAAPWEVRHDGKGKRPVALAGESIAAAMVPGLPRRDGRKQALLLCAPAEEAPLASGVLDGVFTDPPYFDNVQYAELMDFCFAWLRGPLSAEWAPFGRQSTRSAGELTGNQTLGRGLEHFSAGLSRVFCHFARALKPGAPFVFTYHHNEPVAYVPLVVAILDAGLTCTATLPAAAEMTASLHIAGTGSSILDSVFVCRGRAGATRRPPASARQELRAALAADTAALRRAGIPVTTGDRRCLAAGHLARLTVRALAGRWVPTQALRSRLDTARRELERLQTLVDLEALAAGPGRRRA
jgi:adenine-specific DNA methylase